MRQQRRLRLKRLYRSSFRPPWLRRFGTMDDLPLEPVFPETNSQSRSYPGPGSTRETANEPEPESRPAEPESGSAEPDPGSEARPATGWRPEARTAAAAGSKPSGTEPRSAGSTLACLENRTRAGGSRREAGLFFVRSSLWQFIVSRSFLLTSSRLGAGIRKRFAVVAGHDDETYLRDLAAFARARCSLNSSPPCRGRRECRALDAPTASRTIKNKVHEHIHHRSHRNHPAFPTQWFTDYGALSPVRRAFWPPSSREVALAKLDTSVGVPGPHVFSVRIRAVRPTALPRPPHPAPRFVTLRNAPLSGRDEEAYRVIWLFWKTEYFCAKGLTPVSQNSLTGKSVARVTASSHRPLPGELARAKSTLRHSEGANGRYRCSHF